MKNKLEVKALLLVVWVWGCMASCQIKSGTVVQSSTDSLARMRYNNPGLVVELGVGLCALPMPYDYNDDGLIDLIVTAGQDVPDGHTYFFENTGKKDNGIDVFKPGVRIGLKHEFFTPSYVNGELRVLGFNREYNLRDFSESREIYPEKHIHPSGGRIRANQWSYVDYDGDKVLDLIVGVGDWVDYGWDDAFNGNGDWTAGPLHGYVYLIRNTGTDSDPRYEKPEKIKTTDGRSIDVYGRPSPNFADFNGDGSLDLITGEFIDKLTFFKNVGTRERPRYAPGVHLKFKDELITLRGCMIRPVAYDWDGDGHKDIVAGAEEGSVALIRHTGRTDAQGVPVFEPPVYFKQIAEAVKGGVLVTPVGVDWNGDGLQDVIAGNAAGHVLFFENLGGVPPKWAAPKKLEVNGKAIHVMAGPNGSIQGPAETKWGYTVVSVADWNHDQLPDIIMNSILGKVVWYPNVGTRTEPRLAEPRPISVEWEGETPKPHWNWWDPEGKELVTQWRSTLQAIDLNRDGATDMVGLDQEGFLAFYERRNVDGDWKVMAPRRIFFVEKDSASAFDDDHRPVSFPEEDGFNPLAAYDETGKLGYFGREWEGDRWGPYKVTHRVQQPEALASAAVENTRGTPLRLNAGWAGRSGRRKFVFTDWNDDGKLDLLVNSYNVNLLENISDVPGEFLFRNRGRLDEFQLAGHTSCPTVVNFDGDDFPDLLVGAEDGYLYYLKNSLAGEHP